MFTKTLCGIALLSGLAGATGASALTLTPSANIAAGFEWSFDVPSRTISILEFWTPGVNRARIQFTDLEAGAGWTVTKVVHNNTGNTWTNFEHELLNGDRSQSDELDDLSFDQDGPIERSASLFSVLTADEIAERDYLQWSGLPSVGSGQIVTFQYGIRDTNGTNSPFFLSQTANVPEPGSWMMLIAGFGIIGAVARRRAAVTA